MKVLYPNNYISSITASEANASYPITNVQDDHTYKAWKATSKDAVVTIVANAGATAVCIANTNAETITVIVRQGLGIDTQPTVEAWGLDTQDTDETWGLDPVEQNPVTTAYDISVSDIGQLWADFATYSGSFVIELTMTAATGIILQAGVIQVGIPKVYKDPTPGAREGFKDYSIKKELNAGGFYVRKRNVVRTLSFRILEDRDTDFYEFMYRVVQVVGPGPLFFRVVHDKVTDWEWIIFALFDGDLPSGSHDHLDDSFIDVQLVESI